MEHLAREAARLQEESEFTKSSWYAKLAELYKKAVDSEPHAQLVRDYELFMSARPTTGAARLTMQPKRQQTCGTS